MGFGRDRNRRVAAAVFLCALGLWGLWGPPAHAATLSFPFDGAGGDIPMQSAGPAGGIASPPGGWALFSADRNILAAGAGLLAGNAYTGAMLASVYSDTGGTLPHWSRARRAGGDETGGDETGGDETGSAAAAVAPASAAALNAMFYLLLTALMLSAAVGHFRSRRAPAG
jgi:hypothetical protein